jgi:hypothetical protein
MTFVTSLVGLLLFKTLWSVAVKLTIADKVYLWGVGESGEVKATSPGVGPKAEPVTVLRSLKASLRLVDHLDAKFLISRLMVLYLTPRLLISCVSKHPHAAYAYIDIVFMIASHLLFLDRMTRPARGA